jgi:hypothetical protein
MIDIDDGNVLAFIHRECGRFIPKEQFIKLPMPSGADPETMWQLLNFVRRATCDYEYRQDGQTHLSWYSLPLPAQETLIRLGDLTRSGGHFDTEFHLFLKRRRFFYQQIQDIVAAAYRDGITIDSETVRELFSKELSPTNNEERVIANTIDILESIEEYLNWPMDNRLYDELISKIESGTEPSTHYNPNTFHGTRFEKATDCCDFSRMEQAASSPRDTSMHPIHTMISTSYAIWKCLPFERWNGLAEIVLRKLYFAHVGNASLAYVPFSYSVLNWQQGSESSVFIPFAYGEAILESPYGIDATPFYLQLIGFYEQGFTMIEKTVKRNRAALQETKTSIQQDVRLGLRHQQLLSQLLDDPSKTMDVASYIDCVGVAPSTAHNDLHKLVNLGYLTLSIKGKKQIFQLVDTPPL